MTWCLRPTIPLEEAVEVTRRHGWDPGSIAAMSRRRPDGELLRWRLTLRPMIPEVAAVPFFIDWLDSEHPTASLPMAVALTSLTVSHPDPDRLASLLAGARRCRRQRHWRIPLARGRADDPERPRRAAVIGPTLGRWRGRGAASR